jgi:hypothetical protein
MTKKYRCITKVACKPTCNDTSCIECKELFVRYHVNDLLKYTEFLDKQYPTWRWTNIFDKKTKEKIGNFTTRNRPLSKWL